MFRRDRSLKWAAFDVCGSIEPLFTVSLLRIRTSGFAPFPALGLWSSLLTPSLDLENFRLPTFSSSFAHSFRYYLYLSFSRFNRRAPFPDSSGWVQNLDLEVQSAISYMGGFGKLHLAHSIQSDLVFESLSSLFEQTHDARDRAHTFGGLECIRCWHVLTRLFLFFSF